MYGKLENHNLIIAPKRLIVGDTQVWNASASLYLEQGWYPVCYTDEPSDPPEGYYYESGWTQGEDEIVHTWHLEPLPDDIDESEAYSIIFGGEQE